MPRLRRSSPQSPGITRRRCGRGFAYADAAGRPVDEATRGRIHDLAIPPAWTDVWICAQHNGHIQAVGTDAAGRRQYLYHPAWRAQRDAQKHRRTLLLGAALPDARRRTTAHLRSQDLGRERVLSAAFRILDVASFRIGSESYASEYGTFGLATLLREHVVAEGDRVTFVYIAKGGLDRVQSFRDPATARVVSELLARDDPAPELLAWLDGAAWHDVQSGDINQWIREMTGGDFTAKDLRTWNATVLMAQVLAIAGVQPTKRATERAIKECYATVADYLGNTPTVARTSYVDARIVDLYRGGIVIPRSAIPRRQRSLPVHGTVERAVLRLLAQAADEAVPPSRVA